MPLLAFGRRPPSPPGWRVAAAYGPAGRVRGLLGRRALDETEGLWLAARSVHTIGMRVTLDLVWLDGRGAVIRVDRDVGSGRVRSCLAARGGVVEVRAGSGAALAHAIGAPPLAQPSSS